MISQELMGEAFMEMMPDPTRVMGLKPDDTAIDGKMRAILSEAGFDVDAIYSIGNSIWMMAAQAQQEPESTVVGAFVSGVALATLLAKKGAIQ